MGHYVYLRVPQGFFAAGDTFTSRYGDIIKDVKNIVKIVDDSLLYSTGIEQSFWNTWDFLTLCAENGVTINVDKIPLYQVEVDYAGLHVNN